MLFFLSLEVMQMTSNMYLLANYKHERVAIVQSRISDKEREDMNFQMQKILARVAYFVYERKETNFVLIKGQ